MTPDKINELIKTVHPMMKGSGEWDLDCDINMVTESGNTYLAQKLDAITWSICDAMRARSEGRIAKNSHPKGWKKRWLGNSSLLEKYNIFVRGYYEYYLTNALLLTIDLMGFYGVEYDCPLGDDPPIPWDTINTFRICIAFLVDCSVDSDNGADHQDLPAILNAILRIAELDKIDLEWHLEALMKYMSQEVK